MHRYGGWTWEISLVLSGQVWEGSLEEVLLKLVGSKNYR